MRRWWSENGVRTITGLTFAVLVSLLLGFVPLARHHSASSVAVEIGSLSQTQWLVGFLRAPSPNDRAQFRTARQIDAHFKSVPHFGSLAGSSVGVRWMYAVAHLLTANKRDAVMRWLGIAMVACSAWLVVALAWRTGGAGVGSVAGLLFLLLPGTLFYGRSVSAESAMLFATSLTVYAYFRGLERRAWAIASGLAFGLAVITAIESLFLIVPLTALSLTWPQDTADRDARREATPPHVADVDRGRIRLAATWLTPLWLLVCGVGIYVVAHPHLWGAAKGPLIDAIVAELKRPHPQALFFGTVSPRGATPSFATTVELLLTRLPLVVLLSFALGVLFSLRQSARPLVGSSRAVLRGILLVLVALVVAHGLLGSPFYAGTNQLLLYWPWIAIGAAFGLFELGTRITTALSFTERRASMLRAALAFALLGSVAVQTFRVAPYEPAYSNALVARGGQLWGARTELFGEALVSQRLVDWINATLPRSARYAVRSERGHDVLFLGLARRGVLRRDLRYAAELESADYLFVFPAPGRSRTVDWISGFARLPIVHECRVAASSVCAVFRLASSPR